MYKIMKNSILSITIEAFYPKYTNLQAVRWARKPIWLPTAKTKRFRITPRPVIPEEDKEEIKRLYNIYRTQIKSLNNYFKEKYSVENLQKIDFEQQEKDIKVDFICCNKINDSWNEKIRIQREERIAKELEENILIAKERYKQRLQRKEAELVGIEESVRQEKQAAKSFIARESIDEAIEYAINNPVDYNFSLDLNGNKSCGRDVVVSEKLEIKQ